VLYIHVRRNIVVVPKEPIEALDKEIQPSFSAAGCNLFEKGNSLVVPVERK
jgi:hypothetical protein